MTMIVYAKGEDASSIVGGTTALVANLDDDVIDGLKMRSALDRFGRALLEKMVTQYSEPASGRVIGVKLISVDFALVLGRKKRA